jgi:superfamily II DNA or RNA helicase
VRSHIELNGEDLRPEQIARLTDALTIPNPDKDRAVREHVYGAEDMPDKIELWRETEIGYLIPRGVGDDLDEVLASKIKWENEMTSAPVKTSLWQNPILRDEQEAAVVAIQDFAQGVIQAPPGFGKTVTMLEAIRRIGQRSLIIVNNTTIAEQWRARAREHLGLSEVGLVGDAKWVEHDLTIAMQQTLWSRRDSLDGWWETWGLVCLDECHHASAETFYDIIQRFPSRYRVGLSATPKKQKGRAALVRAAIGPTVFKFEESMEGDVVIRETGFTYNFLPTHRAYKDPNTEEMTCEHAQRGCTAKGLIHRNNYSALVNELIVDDARNDIVARDIVSAYKEGRTILVISRRHKQIDDIARRVIAEIGPEDVYRMSGKEETRERSETQNLADSGNIVIFSTVADEALDIPRLDTLVLPFPNRQEGLVEQQIGRIARYHPEKKRPVVYDYLDAFRVSDNQLKERMRVYRRKGLTIT